MSSSPKRDIILSIYSDKRSVFTLVDIAMLIGESNFKKLNERLNYYVHKGKLFRPRKGIYVKQEYNPEELACTLYTPSYISLEYVLLKAGIVFQYDERITAVSYLSRSVDIEGSIYTYRKIKSETLIVTQGIIQMGNVNIATPERAFLDTLYLNTSYHFDNLNPLDNTLINKFLPAYNSKKLSVRVKKLLSNG
ncbi:MAG: hypothetical protein A2266_03875 [Bacteroidetes bacterium RIFOXYA12_FULL_40_10]|nr:MAG: hypothetical protein US49_C0022G0006 [candidate division TM6 bacterium GW2011_GWF2_37_49]OFY88697.1 MAG: hypothetical protein A2266_03875 [Bacteroidetes bacterium RIFOXYA12_FULL_40_10]PKP07055.1 MAG: hypothetical protein CVU10_05750 [Bacteroidetes bacterium HGW-Bacteroidetes-5]HBG23500.1 hypothetical protein [Rikenellaceae bacterium]